MYSNADMARTMRAGKNKKLVECTLCSEWRHCTPSIDLGDKLLQYFTLHKRCRIEANRFSVCKQCADVATLVIKAKEPGSKCNVCDEDWAVCGYCYCSTVHCGCTTENDDMLKKCGQCNYAACGKCQSFYNGLCWKCHDEVVLPEITSDEEEEAAGGEEGSEWNSSNDGESYGSSSIDSELEFDEEIHGRKRKRATVKKGGVEKEFQVLHKKQKIGAI